MKLKHISNIKWIGGKHGKEEILFFLDPPYYNHENMYFGGFEEEEHIRLKKRLDKIKGKTMVCYYSSPLIDELYKDWHMWI